MKLSHLTLILFSILPLQSFAATLLSCSTPLGSNLQAIQLTEDNGKVFVRELSRSGSLSAVKQINAKGWAKKNMVWTSPREGRIHLYAVKYNQQLHWAYEASREDIQIIGYCQ